MNEAFTSQMINRLEVDEDLEELMRLARQAKNTHQAHKKVAAMRGHILSILAGAVIEDETLPPTPTT